MEKIVKEKLGGYLLDVSKYVLTAVLITMSFNYMSSSRIATYIVGGAGMISTLIWGIVLYKDR